MSHCPIVSLSWADTPDVIAVVLIVGVAVAVVEVDVPRVVMVALVRRRRPVIVRCGISMPFVLLSAEMPRTETIMRIGRHAAE